MKRLLVLCVMLAGCEMENSAPAAIKATTEADPALGRNLTIVNQGTLKGSSVSENGSSTRRYLVIHDQDSSADYLIVQDAGIIKLEAKAPMKAPQITFGAKEDASIRRTVEQQYQGYGKEVK